MQLLIFNEEFLVSACHQRALITSLPFVHTARRSYRLNDPVRPPDWGDAFGSPDATLREAVQTLLFRGRRSRNKVSVGEPAEGSLPVSSPAPLCARWAWRRRAGGRGSPLRGARARRLGRVRGLSFFVSPEALPTRLPCGVVCRSARAGACAAGWLACPGSLRASGGACPSNGARRGAGVFGRSAARAHTKLQTKQLLPTDILALATMKNAAKCDT